MKVITLTKAKELLGIEDTASDADITAKIPYIDAKVKQITGNRFNLMVVGDMTSGSLYMSVYSIITPNGTRFDYVWDQRRWYASGINNPYYLDDIGEYLEIGQLLEGIGIPSGAYIDELIYNGDEIVSDSVTYTVPVIKLSSAATETLSGQRVYLGINQAYQDIIAKGIQYLINKTSTTLPSNSLSSKSIGPVSKSFSTVDQEIDNRYGMPAWFVKAFPVYMSGH